MPAPNSSHVHDVTKKFTFLIDYPRSNLDLRVKVLEVLNAGRKTATTQYQQRDIAFALGLIEAVVSELKTQAAPRDYAHNEGVVLDVAAVFGVAPPETLLVEMERASASLPYPHGVYQMLDNWWRDDSAARECWAALAGGPKLIAHYKLTETSGLFGGSFAEFERAFTSHVATLTPALTFTVHSVSPNTSRELPGRIEFRQLRTKGEEHYRSAKEVAAERQRSADLAAATSSIILAGEKDLGGAGPNVGQLALISPHRDRGGARLPDWLSPLSGDVVLDCLLPMPGTSETAREAKIALYGGTAMVQWGPREFAAHEHSFRREVVDQLFRAIVSNKAPYIGLTLKAKSRGSGLSLALAQLERMISTHPRTRAFSLIGDLNRASLAFEVLDMKRAGELAAWAASLGSSLEQLVFILDDVSNASSLGRTRLMAFCNQCRVIFPSVGGPKIAFVFGGHGDQVALHERERDMFELLFEGPDQSACYNTMALRQPTIIADYPGGLNNLMIDHPPARSLGDDAHDAQGFIDYLLQHGSPSRPVSEGWSARTSGLDRDEITVVGATAVAGLLDLPVPERIARVEFSRILRRQTDARGLAGQIDPLTYDGKGNWAGLRLSSPRRAKSLLSRVGRYRFSFLYYVFWRLVSSALRDFNESGPIALSSLDYARHIFQRIGKKEFYLLEDSVKQMIAVRLIAEFIDELEHIFPDSPLRNEAQLMATAQWTGTLSDHLIKLRRRGVGDILHQIDDGKLNADQARLGRLVVRLWCQCARVLEHDFNLVSPEVAVSLMRAFRLLTLRAELNKSDNDILGELYGRIFNKANVQQLAIYQLQENTEDRSRRACELLHVFCQASDPKKQKAPMTPEFRGDPSYCENMSNWLKEMLSVFVEHAATFDPGMWIERARLVRVPLESSDARTQAIEAWNDFLDRAWDRIAFDPLKLATWRGRVEDAEHYGASLRFDQQQGLVI